MSMELNMGQVRWTDEQMEEKIKELGGGGFDVLWENSSPTNTFISQAVNLKFPLSGYKFYEVVATIYKGNATDISSGMVRSDKDARLLNFISAKGLSVRSVVNSGSSLEFSNNLVYASLTSTTTTTNNDYVVPVYVLGYK